MNKKANVYVRNWDLTKYNEEILSRYGLKNYNYWYVGSTEEGLTTRNSKFRYQMLDQDKLKTKNSNRYINNNTKIFINNLIDFYKNECKLDDFDIEKLVFNYYESIEIDTKEYFYNDTRIELHKLLEAKVIGQYILLHKLVDKRNCVLSLKDTEITHTENSIKTKKNNKFYTSPTIGLQGEIDNNTRQILKQNIVIPAELNEIYQSLINSDIIRLEMLILEQQKNTQSLVAESVLGGNSSKN